MSPSPKDTASLKDTASPNAPLRLPSWLDTVDRFADQAWEPLRGSDALNKVFYAASAVGDFSAIWHSVNVLRTWRRGELQQDAARAAVALAAESLLVNQGIKRLFQRERPHDENRPHHLRQPHTSSFPSGHASAATVAAHILGAPNRPAQYLLNGAAAVVATSRLHVRIHHASDVLAGAAVGLAFAKGVRKIWPLR